MSIDREDLLFGIMRSIPMRIKTVPKKVRYRRYASSLVIAAYGQYASFIGIRKP